MMTIGLVNMTHLMGIGVVGTLGIEDWGIGELGGLGH